VALVPDAQIGRNASLLEHGARTLGHSGARVARAASGCLATGVCDRGCPQDAQLGMHVITVPRAVEAGAVLYTRARADKLLVSGARVFGVRAQLLGRDGVPTGRTLRVLSDRVVVACGALATPALLLRSGLGGSSGQLGRNLRLQPAVRVLGSFAGEVRAFEEVPQTYEVGQLLDDGIAIHGLPAPLATLALALPQVGRAHKAILARYARLGALAARVADGGSGSITLQRDGRAVVEYQLSAVDRRRLLHATALAAELLFAAGADEVYPALRGHAVLRDPAEAAALREADLAALDVDLVAHHPMGTARMADDRQKGVASSHGAVHDVQDLHVVDASVLPTATAVAPQTTIVALALRVAEHVSDSVGAPL
jgi:choline dehydrogenase-like flavoprotein